MREFKFRAWAEKKTPRYYGDRTYAGYMVKPFGMTDFDADYFCPDGIDFSDMKIMQFTGFCDNKRTPEYPEGQEIYEGDIVRLIIKFKWGGGKNIDAIVDYERGYLRPSTLDKGHWEVIGNIFENPELYEKQKDRR